MLGNGTSYPSKFSHMPMKQLADYIMTYNHATQAFAVDGANAENVQTTGTATCQIAGIPIASLAADAELDISADLQLSIWLTATAYTAVAVRYVADDNGNKQWYKCIASHTSAAGTKPGQKDSVDSTWRTYWTESSNKAQNCVGNVVASGDSMYYLALCDSAGTLTLVEASDTGVLDADIEIKIPQFDPSVFVAIGLMLIDSAAFTLGTTSTAGIVTFTQLLGPVFPHSERIDTIS